MIKRINKMLNYKGVASLWYGYDIKTHFNIKISFCFKGINSFNKKLDFFGLTKSWGNPNSKEERVLTSTTTASVFSFGQEYQFLLFEKCSYL
jgi:hypothetical protein